MYKNIGDYGLIGNLLSVALVGLGRLDEAERWLARLEATANPLGLFAEEYDPHWRELLGNFPQAFTHIGYINSVLALRQARSARSSAPARPAWWSGFGGPMILNEGPPPPDAPSGDIAGLLKDQMDILRGAFFDTRRGRVAPRARTGVIKLTASIEENTHAHHSRWQADSARPARPGDRSQFRHRHGRRQTTGGGWCQGHRQLPRRRGPGRAGGRSNPGGRRMTLYPGFKSGG